MSVCMSVCIFQHRGSHLGIPWYPHPIGSMYGIYIYILTFTINIPPMLLHYIYHTWILLAWEKIHMIRIPQIDVRSVRSVRSLAHRWVRWGSSSRRTPTSGPTRWPRWQRMASLTFSWAMTCEAFNGLNSLNIRMFQDVIYIYTHIIYIYIYIPPGMPLVIEDRIGLYDSFSGSHWNLGSPFFWGVYCAIEIETMVMVREISTIAYET